MNNDSIISQIHFSKLNAKLIIIQNVMYIAYDESINRLNVNSVKLFLCIETSQQADNNVCNIFKGSKKETEKETLKIKE